MLLCSCQLTLLDSTGMELDWKDPKGALSLPTCYVCGWGFKSIRLLLSEPTAWD